MNLYSMDANNQLHEFKELLPLYLSKDWSACEEILDTLVQAGLLNWTDNGIELHPQYPSAGARSSLRNGPSLIP